MTITDLEADTKPALRLVPKPEGYELRDKRCSRSGDAANWTPADALHHAHESIQGKEVTQLVVYYWARDAETGDEVMGFSNATSSRVEHAYLLQKALHAILSR